MDLDALHGLWFMGRQDPHYRVGEVNQAIQNQGDLVEAGIHHFYESAPDLHHTMGGVGILRLLNRLAPSRFPDDRVWSDISSEPALYRTFQVES